MTTPQRLQPKRQKIGANPIPEQRCATHIFHLNSLNMITAMSTPAVVRIARSCIQDTLEELRATNNADALSATLLPDANAVVMRGSIATFSQRVQLDARALSLAAHIEDTWRSKRSKNCDDPLDRLVARLHSVHEQLRIAVLAAGADTTLISNRQRGFDLIQLIVESDISFSDKELSAAYTSLFHADDDAAEGIQNLLEAETEALADIVRWPGSTVHPMYSTIRKMASLMPAAHQRTQAAFRRIAHSHTPFIRRRQELLDHVQHLLSVPRNPGPTIDDCAIAEIAWRCFAVEHGDAYATIAVIELCTHPTRGVAKSEYDSIVLRMQAITELCKTSMADSVLTDAKAVAPTMRMALLQLAMRAGRPAGGAVFIPPHERDRFQIRNTSGIVDLLLEKAYDCTQPQMLAAVKMLQVAENQFPVITEMLPPHQDPVLPAKEQTEAISDARLIAANVRSEIVGQDDAVRIVCSAIADAAAQRERNGIVLLSGPSGCGKTHLAQTAAQMAKLPCVTIDASAIVPAGIRGMSVDDMLCVLVRAAKNDLEAAGCGVLILDEMDKLACHGGGGPGYGPVVMGQLLRICDGQDHVIADDTVHGNSGSKHKVLELTGKVLPTRRICIIACGAWSDARDERDEKLGFGLGALHVGRRMRLDDLPGLSVELRGRVARYAALTDLSSSELAEILKRRIARWMPEWLSCAIGPAGHHAIVAYAVQRKLGARGLRIAAQAIADRAIWELHGEEQTVPESFVAAAIIEAGGVG